MFILWFAILGFVGYLIYTIINKNPSVKNQEENAFNILKRKYALIEISKKEFENKRLRP